VINVPVRGGSLEVVIDHPETPNAGEITLLCVHGWALDHHSFAPQSSLVTESMAVARFDRRGFGESSLAPDFEAELDDVARILEYIPGPVVLYGVSQGARLVLRTLALITPANVVGVVVQGGHLDGYSVEQTRAETIPFDLYQSWIAAGDINRMREHWIRHPLVAAGNEDMSLAARRALVSGYRGADLMTEGALPESRDILDLLAQLQVPALVITGTEETPSRKAHGDAIADLLRGDVATIDGGGHLCNLSHPNAVNAVLKNFVAACSVP